MNEWMNEHLMSPIFTSLGMSMNRSANTSAISNHTVCLKASTQFKSHNLVQSVSFWNYWASFLWRRQLYSHHNLSMILSSSGDVGSECWWHQCWTLVSFKWFHSIYSTWIYGLCDSHVSQTCHLTGQPNFLTWNPKCTCTNLIHLRSWNSTSETKSQWLIKVCSKQLWLISSHYYRNVLHTRETTFLSQHAIDVCLLTETHLRSGETFRWQTMFVTVLNG
jgi:hypothetical protein